MSEPVQDRYWRDNPAPVLEAVFRRIWEEQMQDIPIVNHALQVAAVGFTEWQGKWLGVLLTPWFLNLMLLPKEADQWQPLAEGKRRELQLPSGDYRFVGGYQEAIGNYQFVSLLSPVTDLPSQQVALKTAREVMELALAPSVDRGQVEEVPQVAEVSCESRRGFLGMGAG